MLTKRKLISILMIMGALVFLFQSMNFMKQKWNSNLTNIYAADSRMREQMNEDPAAVSTQDCTILYIGNDEEDRDAEAVTESWAGYQKWNFSSISSFSEARDQSDSFPGVKLIVADCPDRILNNETELDAAESLLEQGISIVIPHLPDLSILEQNDRLEALCGISRIRQKSVKADGITLYEGFLLGGRKTYLAETEEEKEKQDMELEMPWFSLGSGTKVYMKAVMEDADSMQEDPPVIWRKGTGDGFVFVINGDYFHGIAGTGLLSAMLHETQSCTVSPVINAQNLVIADAPVFADENNEEIQKRYSQSIRSVMRDVIFPSVSRLKTDTGLGLTCMAAPQTDYSDGNAAQQDNFLYYLQMMQTLEGEMGLSGWQYSSVPIEEKLSQDASFWDASAKDYAIASFYRSQLSDHDLAQALSGTLLSSVRTVVEPCNSSPDPVGYLSKFITEQKTVVDGFSCTYMDDFRMRCAETALGYTTILADMKNVLYPETEDDGWESCSRKLEENISTLWKPFSGFDGTTTAQSDERIRNFLSLDYSVQDTGDRIEIETGSGSPSWFLIRMSGREPEKTEGGSIRKLEDNVWLAEAAKGHLTVTTKETEKMEIIP